MIQRSLLALVLAGLIFSPVFRAIPNARAVVEDPLESEASGRNCGTEAPTNQVRKDINASLQRFRAKRDKKSEPEIRPAASIRVDVYFHVINKGEGIVNGDVPDAGIQRQIEVLNETYGPTRGGETPFTFVLVSIDRTTNAEWFRMSPRSRAEAEAKSTLRAKIVDTDAQDLHIYSLKPGNDWLGWSSFPWNFSKAPELDGVVIDFTTLPEGAMNRFNLGKTLTHEVGHWLGLWHTFDGACREPGDEVADTAPEAKAARGCPAEGRHTCPAQPMLDPIHNFMDYVDDVCMTEFTAGQIARMDAAVAKYRGL